MNQSRNQAHVLPDVVFQPQLKAFIADIGLDGHEISLISPYQEEGLPSFSQHFNNIVVMDCLLRTSENVVELNIANLSEDLLKSVFESYAAAEKGRWEMYHSMQGIAETSPQAQAALEKLEERVKAVEAMSAEPFESVHSRLAIQKFVFEADHLLFFIGVDGIALIQAAVSKTSQLTADDNHWASLVYANSGVCPLCVLGRDHEASVHAAGEMAKPAPEMSKRTLN